MREGIEETRRVLTNLIEALGQPDLDTLEGLDDYRVLLQSRNALALLDLPKLNPDAAVFLFHLICERLRGLIHLKLISERQGKDYVAEMVALYGIYRPELLPRLLTNPDTALEITPDA